MKEITFVTGNQNKLREFQQILGVDLVNEPLDLPEIQSLDIEKIASYKAEEAYEILKKPVMIEDTGLYLEALNDFPGPLVKFFLDSIGVEKLSEFKGGARAATCIAYFDGNHVHTFIGETNGTIVNPRGESSFGFDPVFEYEGKTYAEMSKEEKNAISHRGKAIKKLKQFLETK